MASKPTYDELKQRVEILEKEAEKRERELGDYSREMACGLSEVFERLKGFLQEILRKISEHRNWN